MSLASTKGCPSGLAPADADSLVQDPTAFVRQVGGRKSLDLLVRGASCGGCLAKIENAVGKLNGVNLARLNLSNGIMRVEWTGELQARQVVEAITGLGYGAAAYDAGEVNTTHLAAEQRLLTAVAVAGIATVIVMFLSEPVWFGSDLTSEARTMLRWLSALVAIPAAAFAGAPFFTSALAALSKRHVNMDVPVSLAVILALALSIYETATGGEHAYFDASVMLLFFLLIGRYLDARLRRRAYAAANALAVMQSASAARIGRSGQLESVRAAELRTGDAILVARGERLVVDAEIVDGVSDADLRLVTGETDPVTVGPGCALRAGTVNLTAPLRVRATAAASQSLMADIGRLLEAGEQKKSAYRRLADKAAAFYVPQVHLTAAAGFLVWLLLGAGVAKAGFVAVTVLIITCPCALALAAPLVQVVTAGRLFASGIYLSSGDALERIAEVDHVVFDKTGTLTLGDPELVEEGVRPQDLNLAACLARVSRHPYSRALARAAGPGLPADKVNETPGGGVSGLVDGRPARLGSASFVGADASAIPAIWFRIGEDAPVAFRFTDRLRPDAGRSIEQLRALGLGVEIVSGDAEARVAAVAKALGIDCWTSQATPQAKAARLADLERKGRRVLMVGDGLNDAGALANAHASLAPGGAVDVSRLAADCVFSGESLSAAPRIVSLARAARARMRENFGFAAFYNLVAAPVALMGWATPLVAAIAMSASSIVVTLNAMRLSARSGEAR